MLTRLPGDGATKMLVSDALGNIADDLRAAAERLVLPVEESAENIRRNAARILWCHFYCRAPAGTTHVLIFLCYNAVGVWRKRVMCGNRTGGHSQP
jgi:hypothetical protein